MEHTAVVSLAEIKANDRFDLLHEGAADISSAKCVGGLVHESVNQSGDEELTVEVLGLNGARFALNGEDHRFTVLFVELDHFAQDGVAHSGFDDGFGGGDGNGAVVNVDIADHG